MQSIAFKPVGKVRNDFNTPDDYRKIKTKPSYIEVFDAYEDALLGIEENEYVEIIYHLHRSDYKIQTYTNSRPDVLRGVFGTRSPSRPNAIGVTNVKLIKREHKRLLVEGLDALNDTPVLDIKNCDTSLFAYHCDHNPVHQSKLKVSPRIDMRSLIFGAHTDILMIKAAAMHGHYCTGLALGILAAVHAMNILEAESDGMEDLLAITETNNCFADGIQYVTACSFGNNALIFKDIGKTAFTLTKRNGKGIRIAAKSSARQVIRDTFPDHNRLYEKVVAEQNRTPELLAAYRNSSLERAFGTLTLPFEKLFEVSYPKTEVPSYAKVHESVICSSCNESVMITRSVLVNSKPMCYVCGNQTYGVIDGNGIKCS